MLTSRRLGFTKRLRVFLIVLCHVVYLVSGISTNVNAQESYQELEEALVDKGFENLSITSQGDTLQIFYENRRYRFEPHGMAELIEIVTNHKSTSWNKIQLVLLSEQVPMLMMTLPLGAYEDFLDSIIDGSQFYQAIHATFDVSSLSGHNFPKQNNSQFKVDLAVIPNWSAKFGNFDNPVESNINLIPELNMLLTKGLTLKAQLIIPIQNDFLGITKRERSRVRPGNITLNQFVSLDDNFYMNITAGTFNKNRAGVNLDVKKLFSEGRFQIGTNIGFTGYYSFTGIETEHYDKQRYLNATLNAQYRYNPYDLIARLDVGNFLYNVLTARFEIARQFGEIEIGFFALATRDEYDGGFRFSIPLPPRKYTKLRFFRVRPSEAFQWEYRAKGFPQNGVNYNTGYNLTDKLLEYNPDFLKKRLLIELHKLKK